MSKYKRVPLGSLVTEYSERNKTLACDAVYSVTNSGGFVPSTDYFNKEVFSKNISTYKMVHRGMFAYNPSRVNVGSLAWLDCRDTVVVSPLYVVFKIDESKLTQPYLEYFLHSDFGIAQICGLTSGSVRDSLKFSALRQIMLPLPPLPVQCRITAVLDKAQELIAARREQISVLEKLVQDLFIEMFGDPMQNPMGWKVNVLGNVFKVRSSKRVYQRDQASQGVPFLRVSDLVNRITGQGNTANLFISEELYETFKNDGLVPKPDDILVTSRGTLGRCYIIRDTDRFYFQDGMISWLDNSKRKAEAIFIVCMFQSERVRRQIAKKCAGSTVDYLSLGSLREIEIPFPPLSLQKEYANHVAAINKQKSRLIASLAELETLYKSLTQRAFTGEPFGEE